MTNQNSNSPSGGHTDPRRHYHDLRVAKIIRETHDASSIVFEIPDDLAEAFHYKAGQFLTLDVPYERKKLFRCYSLASAPGIDSEHKVTVKRVVDGRISNWVNDRLNVGDTVTVLPPAGDFVLVPEEESELVLFAGGSGITPCISIIKTALATTKRKVRLFYANRDQQSVIFADELSALATANPDRISITHRLDVEDGFLDESGVRAFLSDASDASFYICGPGPFMDVVENSLAALSVATERIHIERFSSPADGETLAPATGAEVAIAVINLDGASHELHMHEGETVLAAAKRAGIEPPFSCESGFCGCCMAKLKQGSVEMKVNDFLSAEEVEEGWVLTCQSVLKGGRCEIEYPD
ncbi:MAG: 3-ketosteroid 9alpha-monooxygenase subunit B [Hyphomicrobiaceae bacterium]|jgi:3-ketosteroid 9alpha-monooxygenase subunit B